MTEKSSISTDYKLSLSLNGVQFYIICDSEFHLLRLNPKSATGSAGTYLLLTFAVLSLKLRFLLLRVELVVCL